MHWVWKYAGVALNPPPPDAAAAAGIDFSPPASGINTQTHYNLKKTIKCDTRLGWNTEPPHPVLLNVVTACRLLLFNITCRHTFPRHHQMADTDLGFGSRVSPSERVESVFITPPPHLSLWHLHFNRRCLLFLRRSGY